MSRQDEIDKIWLILLEEDLIQDGECSTDAFKRLASHLVDNGIGDISRWKERLHDSSGNLLTELLRKPQ